MPVGIAAHDKDVKKYMLLLCQTHDINCMSTSRGNAFVQNCRNSLLTVRILE